MPDAPSDSMGPTEMASVRMTRGNGTRKFIDHEDLDVRFTLPPDRLKRGIL